MTGKDRQDFIERMSFQLIELLDQKKSLEDRVVYLERKINDLERDLQTKVDEVILFKVEKYNKENNTSYEYEYFKSLWYEPDGDFFYRYDEKNNKFDKTNEKV